MVDTLLDVDRLSVERGGRIVISDLSLMLAPGETVLVTGRNGAGKSTLLRTLAGLLPAQAGRVTYGLADEETRGVETVHYLGYEDALKPTLTVEENLGFWAAMLSMPRRPPSPLAGEGARRADEGSGHRSTFPMPSSLPASSDPSSGASRHLLPQGEKGMSGATVDTCDRPVPDALAAFGIGRLAALPAAYLSAGQKRRVALARLLLAHRPIWLLDEPLIALDTTAQATLTGMMQRHTDAGGAILVASHQPLAMPHRAIDLADR